MKKVLKLIGNMLIVLAYLPILLCLVFLLSLKCCDYSDLKTPEDYIIKLPNDYRYACTSSDNCKISLKSYSYESYLPEKIVELAWNERYVIAKQYGMKLKYPDNPENTFKIPDKTKIYYWILDTYDKISYGPYKTKQEFIENKKIFGIETLQLKDVNKYEKVLED